MCKKRMKGQKNVTTCPKNTKQTDRWSKMGNITLISIIYNKSTNPINTCVMYLAREAGSFTVNLDDVKWQYDKKNNNEIQFNNIYGYNKMTPLCCSEMLCFSLLSLPTYTILFIIVLCTLCSQKNMKVM